MQTSVMMKLNPMKARKKPKSLELPSNKGQHHVVFQGRM